MGVRKRQQEVRAMRAQMRSLGQPVAGRDVRVRFWEAIARGLPSEEAAVEVGVACAVGTRWFRQAGGMTPISLASMSERYLLFREREEIAILASLCECGTVVGFNDGFLWTHDLLGERHMFPPVP